MDAEGNEVKEVMTFKGLGDFGAEKIKENSEFLSGLDIEREQSLKIARQLSSNKALRKVLENPVLREALAEVLSTSIQEINEAQSNSKI